MQIGGELTREERELMLKMLYRREGALTWEFEYISKIRPEVTPLQKIRTIEHKAWQAPRFPIPKSLYGVVTEMLKERLRRGVIEPCYGPYRNPWFFG
jgi:hypothetical protein